MPNYKNNYLVIPSNEFNNIVLVLNSDDFDNTINTINTTNTINNINTINKTNNNDNATNKIFEILKKYYEEQNKLLSYHQQYLCKLLNNILDLNQNIILEKNNIRKLKNRLEDYKKQIKLLQQHIDCYNNQSIINKNTNSNTNINETTNSTIHNVIENSIFLYITYQYYKKELRGSHILISKELHNPNSLVFLDDVKQQINFRKMKLRNNLVKFSANKKQQILKLQTFCTQFNIFEKEIYKLLLDLDHFRNFIKMNGDLRISATCSNNSSINNNSANSITQNFNLHSLFNDNKYYKLIMSKLMIHVDDTIDIFNIIKQIKSLLNLAKGVNNEIICIKREINNTKELQYKQDYNNYQNITKSQQKKYNPIIIKNSYVFRVFENKVNTQFYNTIYSLINYNNTQISKKKIEIDKLYSKLQQTQNKFNDLSNNKEYQTKLDYHTTNIRLKEKQIIKEYAKLV